MVCGQQKQIARSKRLDDLLVDLIAYVFHEQKKEEDVVLELACIHADIQFVITGAEGGVEFGFSNRHGTPFPA